MTLKILVSTVPFKHFPALHSNTWWASCRTSGRSSQERCPRKCPRKVPGPPHPPRHPGSPFLLWHPQASSHLCYRSGQGQLVLGSYCPADYCQPKWVFVRGEHYYGPFLCHQFFQIYRNVFWDTYCSYTDEWADETSFQVQKPWGQRGTNKTVNNLVVSLETKEKKS